MPATAKPRVACELTPERVIAARAGSSGALDTVAARTLRPGSLVPALATSNILNDAAVRQAIIDALAAVGSHSRDVIAVVPDAAVRIVLLEFEELPDRRQEADSVVRFRLKKSLPFDADEAALSYDVRRANGAIKVIAAVAPSSVLAEYESLFRQAGYNPGIVLPSMLAALGPVQASGPALVLKVDAVTTTVAIVQQDDLLLYRTLENTRGNLLDAGALAEDIYPSLIFVQDNYNMKVDRILLGGLASAHDLGTALESETGAKVEDLVSASQVGQQGTLGPSVFAGVVGALAG